MKNAAIETSLRLIYTLTMRVKMGLGARRVSRSY